MQTQVPSNDHRDDRDDRKQTTTVPTHGQTRGAETNQPAGEDASFSERMQKSFKAEDRPMGHQSPSAPFALVALTYLTVLAVAALTLAGIAWFL